MVSVVVFEFSVMRCQPLRRALVGNSNWYIIMKLKDSLLEIPKYINSEDWSNPNVTKGKTFVCAVMANLAYARIGKNELDDRDNVNLIPSDTYYEVLKSGDDSLFESYIRALETENYFVIERSGSVLVSIKFNNVIFVSMRGTRGFHPADWRINLNAKKVAPYPLDASKAKVHSGFYLEVESFYQDLMREIKDKNWTDVPIYFVGHSLGGALAALTYAKRTARDVWYYHHFEDKHHNYSCIESYTFGMPRWGNAAAISLFNSPQHFCVSNDSVPRLPPECLGYVNCKHNRSVEDSDFSYVKYYGLKSRVSDVINVALCKKLKDHSIETYVERVFQQL